MIQFYQTQTHYVRKGLYRMYVIADIEWISKGTKNGPPTQIFASRTDGNWNVTDSFSSLICPPDTRYFTWEHMAYTGAKPSAFLSAPTASVAFGRLKKWLRDDDIIIWWYPDSDKMFRNLFLKYIGTYESHKSVILNDYLYDFLSGQQNSKGSPYRMAEARGIDTDKERIHCSRNDVRVLLELLTEVNFPQERLSHKLESSVKEPYQPQKHSELPYLFDERNKRIHIRGCNRIENNEFIIERKNLVNPLRKEFVACDCCKKEFGQALRARNRDILSRASFTYVYAPDSNVYHRPECKHILSARSILGARYYSTVEKSGRIPCKLCRPTPEDVPPPITPQYVVSAANGVPPKNECELPKDKRRAITRQQTASRERSRKLADKNLSETERADIYTLTQPEFAFFAGKGYQNFHLSNCHRLHNLNNIRGFKTYRDAVKAGLTPCKTCKPTSKYDVTVSLPITSRIRNDESISDIEMLCKKYKFPCSCDGTVFSLETPVGRWKIHTNTSPFELDHINTVKTPSARTFHRQPRLFLSLHDAFHYIKRHDTELARQKANGTVYMKLVEE